MVPEARGAQEQDARGAPKGSLPGEARANQAVMDRIADAFDATRDRAWAPVEAFLDSLPPGQRILDLAAGNGRHAVPAAERGHRPVVVDVSGALVTRARRRAVQAGHQVVAAIAEAGNLPFQDDSFDQALYIAGLHCIRGHGNRIQSLRELQRVLRPGGGAMISVWSADQARFRDIVRGQRHADAVGGLSADTEPGDVLVPWSRDVGEPVDRFFHVYHESELRRELQDSAFEVHGIEHIDLTGKGEPDNLFATVSAKR